MNIIPVPRDVEYLEGEYLIKSDMEIQMDEFCGEKELFACNKIKEVLNSRGINTQLNKRLKDQLSGDIRVHKVCETEVENVEGYILEIKDGVISIKGRDPKGIFYGIQTLIQVFNQCQCRIPNMKIVDEPQFKVRGFYHDITRGKVPTLEKLKEIVDNLARYKINQFQLYVEHVFPFTGHGEISKITDPITPEEILELDQYCIKNNIEMVPSIATFGHLYHLLSSQKFGHLCEKRDSIGKEFSWVDRMRHHTIDISNEESLAVIRKMIQDYLPLFSSNKFNICCDETFDLGSDRSKEYVESLPPGKAYLEFLKKLIEIIKENNKIPMFWGDIILKYPELLGDIDEDVICLNWNYSSEANEDSTKTLKESGREFYNCPGVWGWDRFMNDISGSFENIKRMVNYGEKYGCSGILNTDWGDYGHVNFYSSSKPGMILGGALSWNNELNKEETQKIEEKISWVEFGDGEIVSLLRELGEQHYICFMEIVWWLEDKIEATTLLKDRPELFSKYLQNKDEKGLRDAFFRAVEIRDMLERKLINCKKNKIDIKEFIIAAEGVALMNSLFLQIKEMDFHEEVKEQIHQREELSQIIEEWIERFKERWRYDNKESELYRVSNFFEVVCKYLRG